MFAALNTLDGSIIETCMPKHRHQEWIRFLNQIKRSVPKDKQIHIICDNYATHKHQKVVNWLKRNTRFHVHFTPTSASWLKHGRTLLPGSFRTTASARGFPFGS